MANFLLPLAFENIFFKSYDFVEDTITTDWTVNNSGGAGASNFAASTSKEGGAITGATGTTSNGTISINFDGIYFDANRSPGMLVRLKTDIITSMYFEMGFSDVPTQPYTINWAINTPTLQSNATTDVASVVVDTSATQKSAVLVAQGSTDVTAAKVALSDVIGVGANPFIAGTYMTVLIQIAAPAVVGAAKSSCSATVNGDVGMTNSLSVGLDTAIPLRPYIIFGTRNTAAKTVDIDLIQIWCDRV
jgi:hypothetical protein